MERKVRTNDKFRSLINGRHYVVTRISPNGEVFLREDKEGEVGAMSAPENALGRFFVYEGNDTPYPAPEEGEYLVADGRLFRHYEAVETGSLEPVGIVALTEAGVYMTARAKDRPDKYDLFFYDPQEDVFRKALRENTRYNVIFNDGRLLGILAHDEESVRIAEGEAGAEPVAAAAVREKAVFLIGAHPVHTAEIEGYLHAVSEKLRVVDTYVHDDEKKDVETSLFFVSEVSLQKAKTVEGRDVFALPADLAGEEASQDVTRVTRYQICLNGETGTYDGTDDVAIIKSPVTSITPVRDDMHNALVVTSEGIVMTNYGHHPRIAKGRNVLDAVQKYPYLLEMEISDNDRGTLFTLGNEQYEMAKIRVEKTRDRGYVTTVTEGIGFPAFRDPASGSA